MSTSFELPEVPALAEQRGASFAALVALMQRLLAPDGCPWDREQTMLSLKRYLVEESAEVLDAIDAEDDAALCEELGDLALQIVFLTELARKKGAFGPDDVMRSIVSKLVRRHPHVFGDAVAEDPHAVERTWAQIKAQEKQRRPLLDDIPRSLPALAGAAQVSRRVSQVGFDWPDAEGSRAKVTEELSELEEAMSHNQGSEQERVESELGDLLFALVNLARHHGVDAEAALRKTTDRFRQRFSHVERRVLQTHGDWPRDQRGKPTRGLALDELDGYWNEAKANER